MSAVAVVGMACRYPDAASPRELWQTAVARRRAFRAIPPERLPLALYGDGGGGSPDHTYLTTAALVRGWSFDRARFHVSGRSHRAADPTHWLALDVAAAALEEAGLGRGALPRDRTGVLVGNSLTGEVSRAHLLRLRWPYVAEALDSRLRARGWDDGRRRALLAEVEEEFKAPFEPLNEESLAGALSNTIAGRICNHFDLHGGGYTVDGACASSLLAVARACNDLLAGDLDAAVAGGVDVSLDPLELVGFARTGALARDDMRVYDRDGQGFWPGEGCGMVVLVREEDARARGLPVLGLIPGWGVSSDGAGGLTRPDVEGQGAALRRAWERVGAPGSSAGYFEGHGTGTVVGDAVELEALSALVREGERVAGPRPAVGSIKANIGHTKAAAGVAGLVKALMAVRRGVVPPTTGCVHPHPLLEGPDAALRVLDAPEPWPEDRPRRAGVSAFGFGGINTHVVVEAPGAPARRRLPAAERRLAREQDVEVYLFAAESAGALAETLTRWRVIAPGLSRAEAVDAAAAAAARVDPELPWRAAVVASGPEELAGELGKALERVVEGHGRVHAPPRIGFLFPGQGGAIPRGGGAWVRRFPELGALLAPPGGDPRTVATDVVQPAVVRATLAGLRVLESLGFSGAVGVGHSLGELTALHWGGALGEDEVVELATERGRLMALHAAPGAMAAVRAPRYAVEALVEEVSADPSGAWSGLAVAALNGPEDTVVGGPAAAVEELVSRAATREIPARRLPVSHGFHAPGMGPAAGPFRRVLEAFPGRRLERTVASTVTGGPLGPAPDVPALLHRQVTDPVLFTEAVAAVEGEVELWIEVGPGSTLRHLVSRLSERPAVHLDVGGPSLRALLAAAARAWVAGAPLRPDALFRDRFFRPFDPDALGGFLESPCGWREKGARRDQEPAELPVAGDGLVEAAPHAAWPGREKRAWSGGDRTPVSGQAPRLPRAAAASATADSSGVLPEGAPGETVSSGQASRATALETVRALVAERAELPGTAIGNDHRLMADLHLNSITVASLVAEATAALGLDAPASPTDFADASVGEVAAALERLREGQGDGPRDRPDVPDGLAPWVRPFEVVLEETPLARGVANRVDGSRAADGRGGEDDSGGESTGGSCGSWVLTAGAEGPEWHALARALKDRLERGAPGGGTLLLLDRRLDRSQISRMLDAGRRYLEGHDSLIVVHDGGGGGALARSLYFEGHGGAVTVVQVPPGDSRTPEWVVAEARVARGFREVVYDGDGRRLEPMLRPARARARSGRGGAGGEGADGTADEAPDIPLAPGDVVVASGGARGITAECMLALAEDTGIRPVLLGRADPARDEEVARNLARFRRRAPGSRYVRVDVTDAEAVGRALEEVRQEMGPVRGIVHGAARNRPVRFADLDIKEVEVTLAPKLDGLRALLAAAGEDPRVVVAFGSIIGQMGMAAEAHYALANEAMALEAETFAASHPSVRVLILDWSVWSDVGMGVRLGRVDALTRAGVSPVAPDAGVRAFLDLLAAPPRSRRVVVTGRVREMATLRWCRPDPPLLRFLERPRVHFPGVEIVVDADVSTATDSYLEDHVFRGDPLLPAVMSMEAMVQAAAAAADGQGPVELRDLRFLRPVVVREPIGLRTLAQVDGNGDGWVEVAVRASSSGFQADHVRGMCRFLKALPDAFQDAVGSLVPDSPSAGAPDPEWVYDHLLFHGRRFRRLRRYRVLRARECVAEIAPAESETAWFGPYLPRELLLGDPTVRDAALHVIQACIPHETVIPVGAGRVIIGGDVGRATLVRGRERGREGDVLVWDVDLEDAGGIVLERWRGLRLGIVGSARPVPWPPSLVGPFLERCVSDLVPGCSLAAAAGGGEGSAAGPALLASLGIRGEPVLRPDGKPELPPGLALSATRTSDLRLACTAPGILGVDAEPVAHRSETEWERLVGRRRPLAGALSEAMDEDADTAATRVWCAIECLKKAGFAHDIPLTITSATGGRAVLAAGEGWVVTVPVEVEPGGRTMVGVLWSPGTSKGNGSRRTTGALQGHELAGAP